MTLGRTIAGARKSMGMTLRTLSQEINLSGGYLCDIEHDRRQPSRETMKALSKALGIPLQTLADADTRPLARKLRLIVSKDPIAYQFLLEGKQ